MSALEAKVTVLGDAKTFLVPSGVSAAVDTLLRSMVGAAKTSMNVSTPLVASANPAETPLEISSVVAQGIEI